MRPTCPLVDPFGGECSLTVPGLGWVGRRNRWGAVEDRGGTGIFVARTMLGSVCRTYVLG